MTQQITVFGFGAVGRPLVEILTARGNRVRVATRNLPDGVEHMACDVLDAADVQRALVGSAQAVLAVGFAYDSRLGKTAWPQTMTNLIGSCADAGARLVLIDNLYQLGAKTEPSTEDRHRFEQAQHRSRAHTFATQSNCPPAKALAPRANKSPTPRARRVGGID